MFLGSPLKVTLFPSRLQALENILGNNVSATMYLCLQGPLGVVIMHLSMLGPRVGGGGLPPGNLTFLGKPMSNSLPPEN